MRPSYAAERAATWELPAGTLAAFLQGLDWGEIQGLDRRRGAAWWRMAIADSEQRGFLVWDRAKRVWRLTDEGVFAVRGVS